MKAKFLIMAISANLTLVACATRNPEMITNSVQAASTNVLWLEHRTTSSPLELAFIEAELGRRGETNSGGAYLGQRTGSAFGSRLYARSTSSSNTRNCSDFGNAAAAQQFFLAGGGPINEPHNLDADGDGLACEWGTQINQTAAKFKAKPRPVVRRYSSSGCFVGPRGGTYTITSSGRKNYGGC